MLWGPMRQRGARGQVKWSDFYANHVDCVGDKRIQLYWICASVYLSSVSDVTNHDSKKLPSSKDISQLNIFLLKRGTTLVKNDVLAPLTDSCKQTIPSVLTLYMACVTVEKVEKKGTKMHYSDKEPVGNKQPSLVFLTWKIQKGKKYTQVRSADLFFRMLKLVSYHFVTFTLFRRYVDKFSWKFTPLCNLASSLCSWESVTNGFAACNPKYSARVQNMKTHSYGT